jgi:hypothetical protein
MSAPSDEEGVGYGRPPKHARWKKGQSGNAGPKKRKPALISPAEILDRLLGETIEIVENGVARRVSTLEAILLRLFAAEMAGNQRAGKVRLKYLELIPRNDEHSEIIIRDVPDPAASPPRARWK